MDKGIEPSDAEYFHRLDREEIKAEELDRRGAEITRDLEREIEFARELHYPHMPALRLLPELCALFEQHGDEIMEKFVPLLAERSLEGTD